MPIPPQCLWSTLHHQPIRIYQLINKNLFHQPTHLPLTISLPNQRHCRSVIFLAPARFLQAQAFQDLAWSDQVLMTAFDQPADPFSQRWASRKTMGLSPGSNAVPDHLPQINSWCSCRWLSLVHGWCIFSGSVWVWAGPLLVCLFRECLVSRWQSTTWFSGRVQTNFAVSQPTCHCSVASLDLGVAGVGLKAEVIPKQYLLVVGWFVIADGYSNFCRLHTDTYWINHCFDWEMSTAETLRQSLAVVWAIF